jgi:hypothetical protein
LQAQFRSGPQQKIRSPAFQKTSLCSFGCRSFQKGEKLFLVRRSQAAALRWVARLVFPAISIAGGSDAVAATVP